MPTVNPVVLSKFRAALDKLYGDRIERVVLLGSRARGDARLSKIHAKMNNKRAAYL